MYLLILLSSRYLRLLLSLTGFSLILSSCQKETHPQVLPVRLTFSQLEPVSEMRLFAGGIALNTISNQQTLQHFLERKYSTNTGTGTIHYQSNFVEPDANSYRNTSFTYNGNDIVKYVADIIEITRIDGIAIMKSRVTNRVDDWPIVKSGLFKYKFDINANGTYNYQYIVTEGDRASDVSLLYYKLVRYNDAGERVELAFGTVHNQFNESFIKTLQARDTLAIKEYRLRYTGE